jgi:hypothetical protein
MSFNRREEAERLFAGFRRSKVGLQSGIKLEAEKNAIWLSRELAPEDMASLRDRLDEVVAEWIRLWKEFGGLKALVP